VLVVVVVEGETNALTGREEILFDDKLIESPAVAEV
jgi:hypothetical protein